MLLIQAALLLLVLPLCVFTPGFLVVRRLRWNPLEKLCGAAGLSIVMLYGAAGCVYCFVPRSAQTGAFAAIAVLCAGAGIVAARQIRGLLRNFRVRRVLAGFGFLLLWTLVMLAMIRHYSGFGWGQDWLEHFQRSLFFLHRWTPLGQLFGDEYHLAARPPLMNVVATFFLGLTDDRYELFQIVFVFLNLLIFLPCVLFLPALGLTRRPRVLPLVALFALSPIVMENVTYTWTKCLASFFVILALWFYLSGVRKPDRVRMAVSFFFLAAGLLVHYLAGPYVVVLSLHYLVFVFWKRPHKFLELAGIAAAAGLLLSTWFGWSVATYGVSATFRSNTSVTSAQKYQGNNFVKIGANMLDSVVPTIVREGVLHSQEMNQAGLVRDNVFAFYQINLIFAMGLAGGPLVIWLLYRFVRGRVGRRLPEWRFWRLVLPCTVVLGLAVVGERDLFGTAHLTLIPLELLGIALIAAAFPWPRWAAAALLAGCLVDFGLGVFLQAKMEALENTPSQTLFTIGVRASDGKIGRGPLTPGALSVAAWENWFSKHRFALDRDVSNQLSAATSPDALRVRTALAQDLEKDKQYWGGWWSQNNYEMNLLGDHIAGPAGDGAGWLTPSWILLLLGLIWKVQREFAGKPRARAAAPPARIAKRSKK